MDSLPAGRHRSFPEYKSVVTVDRPPMPRRHSHPSISEPGYVFILYSARVEQICTGIGSHSNSVYDFAKLKRMSTGFTDLVIICSYRVMCKLATIMSVKTLITGPVCKLAFVECLGNDLIWYEATDKCHLTMTEICSLLERLVRSKIEEP